MTNRLTIILLLVLFFHVATSNAATSKVGTTTQSGNTLILSSGLYYNVILSDDVAFISTQKHLPGDEVILHFPVQTPHYLFSNTTTIQLGNAPIFNATQQYENSRVMVGGSDELVRYVYDGTQWRFEGRNY